MENEKNPVFIPLYYSYLETFEPLNDEQLGKVIRAVLKKYSTGEAVELEPIEKLVLNVISRDADKALDHYKEVAEQRKKAAEVRWGKKQQDANASTADAKNANASFAYPVQCKPMQMDANDAIEMEKEKGKEKEISPYGDNIGASEAAQTPPKKKNSAPVKRFVPPTPDEVNAFCAEHGYNIDGGAFVDWYQRAGWVLKGGTPMKDWQAAVRTWVRNDKKRDSAGYTPAQSEYGSMMDFLNEEIAKGGLSFNDQSGNSTDSQGTQNSVPEFLLTDAPF